MPPARPVVLLVDRHDSHLNLELFQLAEKNGIYLCSLLQNATHLVQPADVGLFGPMKKSWYKAVRLLLMKHHKHDKTSEFLDIMFSRAFFPLISRPTRITSSTASLIDNIFTNDVTNCAVSGLLFTDISDHLPIFSISNECLSSSRKTQWLMFRDKNANNVCKFKDELQTVNWSEVRESSDPSSAYDIFLSKYTDIYNNFPLKKVKIKNNGLTKPWISKALLN